MDLNYYLQREQVERARAAASSESVVRAVHQRMADLYRERIDDYRRAAGAHPRTIVIQA